MNSRKLEKSIGYTFKDKNILAEALTHSSYGAGNCSCVSRSNERLEFLGDAFLDAVTSVVLYIHLPEACEGELSKIRSQIVCEKALASVGRRINIGACIDMGRGEEQSGARNRESIVADATEALIGAVYIDGGFAAMRELVERLFSETVDDAIHGRLFSDYKTRLQELVQREKKSAAVEYAVIGESGPDHDKTFCVCVSLDGVLLGRGTGKSKKEAEQNAAREALGEGMEHVL